HKQDANGVMQMIAVPEGFAIPAGASHALQRGGDHVMLLGLTAPLKQGDMIDFTLTFEHGGAVTVQVPVDLERETAAPTMPEGAMNHGAMNHGAMEGGTMDHGTMKHGTVGN
ncbi:MAG: copper chaperone PCu(A)C, partial [Paracoccaceae bacterium]|nr:copper chaperone PCu(A)C [Paracoccaceae bacterium]